MKRLTTDNVENMGMYDLAHNQCFAKGGEAWYRNFEREITVRNLIREIATKHAAPADLREADDDLFDEIMLDNLQYGTDELEGVIAMYYTALWALADMRTIVKLHEDAGTPLTHSADTLKQAVEKWGQEKQTDMAIEEMSELTKALLKHRRAAKDPVAWDYEKTKQNISEELADVYIMLWQLMIIYGNTAEVQEFVDIKTSRLSERLTPKEERHE